MAGGWSRDGAVQDQIDASVDDEVQRARPPPVQVESERLGDGVLLRWRRG